ncbi:Transcription factor PIF1 [Glycine max]|nr:Transcription factor PIF1 [Glycine max]
MNRGKTNHCVLDFEIQMDDDDEEYPIPVSKKPSTQNDEIMELLWQNGQVVMQNQNQRPFRKQPPTTDGDGPIPAREIRSSEAENYNSQHLFMQEDEMASWLHYPIHEDPPPFDHHDFCADILYPPPNATASQNQSSASVQSSVRTTELQHPAPRPPIPPPRRQEHTLSRIHNFTHFAKHGNASSSSKAAAPAQPTVATAEHVETGRASVSAAAGKTPASDGGRETATCDVTVTSSPGGSSGSAEPVQREPVVNRKRKGREQEESEYQSEDVDFESPEAKKQVRGSTSTKRSHAAEVHNLSERRRRDRINEKMKALQELIPRCNKSDKASMLDEAIEYLKSLQLQVQMMSMGCGMVPMIFPGIQQYMPPMGMGIGMGMGMGMEMGMGMNRSVMPFPNMLASSTLPAATATAHLGPRFPMPPFHMPHVATPDSSRMQGANHPDNNMLNSLGTLDPDQSCIPNFTDPYQQYLSLQQAQLQLMQTKHDWLILQSSPENSNGAAHYWIAGRLPVTLTSGDCKSFECSKRYMGGDYL